MRRKERERLEPEFMELVFNKSEEMCLAMLDDGWPYALYVNFAKSDNFLYIHCAPEGHKLDCIRKNPKIAFTLACDTKIDRENFTTYYKSVCGRGLATIVENKDEKARALELIGKRYKSLCPPPNDAMTSRLSIIRIEITELTGKQSKGKYASTDAVNGQ